MLLPRETRTSGCKLGPMPDRRCSPGAYYSRADEGGDLLGGFRTSTIRNVPESEKFAVEREYGLAPSCYGTHAGDRPHRLARARRVERHREPLSGGGEVLQAHPGYHVKDKLENKLHALVCAGQIGLRSAQRQIASNWERLFKRVFGGAP